MSDLFRWKFRCGTSSVVISAPAFFDARTTATRMLGCGLDNLVWDRCGERDDVEIRWVGHDAGRVPTKRREVRTRGEDGKWNEWEPA